MSHPRHGKCHIRDTANVTNLRVEARDGLQSWGLRPSEMTLIRATGLKERGAQDLSRFGGWR
eukprot:538866-Rhodomonas_salina.1